MLNDVLRHLRALVAIDTRNPPRHIAANAGIMAYLATELAGFRLEVTDHGEGCVSLLAVRGNPQILFNCHVDTVPADPSWARDPFDLDIQGERAVGLGACDIKGAAACMLAAAQATRGDAALLFTSDEEAGQSRCVRAFCAAHPAGPSPFEAVIVAEPTEGRAVLEHRGLATCTGVFRGTAGHSSGPTALDDSAVHMAAQWTTRAVEYARRSQAQTYRTLEGIRFNVGVLEGGTKPNVIASEARVRFGVRPLPNQRPEEVLAALQACAPDEGRVQWQPGFTGPPLPARLPTGAGQADQDVAPVARAIAGELGLAIGPPVDFWTEASLFSEAGYAAIVLGPGHIAQAHTAGEWVSLAQLESVAHTYARLLGGEPS